MKKICEKVFVYAILITVIFLNLYLIFLSPQIFFQPAAPTFPSKAPSFIAILTPAGFVIGAVLASIIIVITIFILVILHNRHDS